MTTDQKDLIGIAVTILLGVWLLPGCGALRYDLGFRAGTKAYKHAKKHDGFVPVGFGSGYIGAIRFHAAMDQMEKADQDFRKAIEQWTK